MNSPSFYELCLRAYPVAFRERHGAEMLRIFKAECRTARAAGPRAAFAFMRHTFSDFARTVLRERLAAQTHTGWLAFCTATLCGVMASRALFSSGQFAATAVLLFASTVLFSYVAGVRTWRWPVTVAAWFPARYLFQAASGQIISGSLLDLLAPPLFMFGWALIISFVGTGTGLLLRFLFPLRLGGGKSDLSATRQPKTS